MFTDRDSAFENLYSGEYYAAIIIPEDFTSNVLSLATDKKNKERSKIEYYVNERQNGAAVKVTDTGASTIENKINEQFVSKVSEVVSSVAYAVAGGAIQTAYNTSETVSDRLIMVSSSIDALNSVLDKGENTVSNAKSTIFKANGVLHSVKSECESLTVTIEKAKDTCQNARLDINNIILQLQAEAG